MNSGKFSLAVDGENKYSRKQTIITGSFFAVAQSATRMIVGIISVPITISYLGKERYGLWMSVLSALAVVSILDGGLFPVLKNKLTEAFAKNDDQTFAMHCATGLATSFIIVAIGVIASPFVVQFNWAHILNVKDVVATKEATPLALSLFWLSVITLSLSIVDAIYAARMDAVKLQKISLFGTVSGFIFLLLAIRMHAGLVWIAAVASFPGVACKIWLCRMFFDSKQCLISISTKDLLLSIVHILKVSVSFIGIKICEVCISALPTMIIIKTVGLTSVSMYSISLRLVSIPLVLVTAVLPVIWPTFSVAWVRGEKEWLKNRLIFLSSSTFVIFAISGVLNTITGPTFISMWTRGVIDASASLILALSGLVAIQAVVYCLSTFLHSISDFNFELICHAGAALLLLVYSSHMVRSGGLVGLIWFNAAVWGGGCLIPMVFRIRFKLCNGGS